MKIIVFSDLHGNIYALNNLLKTKDYKEADLRICLGDYVAMGPRPNETTKKITLENCIMLLGNNDSYVVNGLPHDEVVNMPKDRQQHIKYVRSILEPLNIGFLKMLPYHYVHQVGNKKLYFTHYAWEDNHNVKDCPINPTAHDLQQAFLDIDADYIFFGHKHEPVGAEVDGKVYCGVGSVGMSYPANYVVVDVDDNNNITITRKQLDYDFYRMKQDMLDQNYVCAETFLKFFD